MPSHSRVVDTTCTQTVDAVKSFFSLLMFSAAKPYVFILLIAALRILMRSPIKKRLLTEESRLRNPRGFSDLLNSYVSA